MSDNLVKDYLEEIEIINPDQFFDYVIFDDRWDIYKLSDEVLFYVKYELVGKIGYAFCAKVTCRRMTNDFESFFYAVNHNGSVREEWDCDDRDKLCSNAISILKPY